LGVELVAEQPANLDVQSDLAGIYNDLGLALEFGDNSGSLENHRKALAIRQRLVASGGKYQRDLSITYVNLGRALYLSGDIKGALDVNSKALALRTTLLSEDPSNADYRRLLAIIYQNDGDYRAQLGDTAGALESFRKKLPLDEQLLAADPVNAQAHGDFGYTCERLGDLLAEARDYAQAISYHRKALAIWEKATLDEPQNMSVAYRRIVACARIGHDQAKLGNRAASLEDCSKALSLLKEIRDHATSAEERTSRAEAYSEIGSTYAALAESKEILPGEGREYWRSARENYQQSLDIYLDLRHRGISTSEDAGDKVTAKIARCDSALAGSE
jgi:tetratricopeptide (TPR) repeat protein